MNYLGYDFSSPFVFDSRQNILEDKDLGIVNGCMAIGTPYKSVCAVSGLYAPPYVSSNFQLDIRFMGERVRAASFVWLPNAIYRQGSISDAEISAVTVLGADMRSAILKVSIDNTTSKSRNIPVQIRIAGGLDYSHDWQFDKPIGVKAGDLRVEEHQVCLINNDKAWRASCSLPGLRYFSLAGFWETIVELKPGAECTFFLGISMGPAEQALSEAKKLLSDPEQILASASEWLKEATDRLFSCLPSFFCEDERLIKYYNRSLVHYITNTWHVEDFVLNPYMSNGSINGGCVCVYLWDYYGGWKIHPLVDQQTHKAEIKQFLRCDLSRSFAFMPVHGQPFGPWYPVNQEKIISLIYYYIKHTGDKNFLQETVRGMTVLERVIHEALLTDRPNHEYELYDYGVDGEHHLELRRGIPYHGILPDLNARNYLCYTRAYELSVVAGQPCEMLLERADALKKLLREQLWDENAGWFRFISEGKADYRYTVQMFKLIDNPVLDQDMLEGLLGHLNEREFLSEFGLHSMSKQDVAYDQVDIDNGGGGICSVFVPIIVEQLYNMGYADRANDLLHRTLWWGERVPYWGDSFAANAIEYRTDTPLQCTIGGVAGAQAIIFGAFGIKVAFDGSITINPPEKQIARGMKLMGVKIRDKEFDVELGDDEFTVLYKGHSVKKRYGESIVIK
jgi:hypothetical protein